MCNFPPLIEGDVAVDDSDDSECKLGGRRKRNADGCWCEEFNTAPSMKVAARRNESVLWIGSSSNIDEMFIMATLFFSDVDG